MFRFNLFRGFYFETPDPAGGGGAGVAPAQPDPGQGTGDDAFRGMFPDVPDEDWESLSPHLKNVQGHVTKLEQQYSPFKPYLEAGYTPEQVQGLLQFSQDFDKDPLEAWIRMGQLLQQDQNGQRVVAEDLDFEMLGKIARGEDIEDDVTPPGTPPGPTDPNLAAALQMIQKLEAQVNQLTQGRQQDQQTAQAKAQERVLQEQFGKIREGLKGQLPEEALSDEELRARMVIAKGNTEAVIAGLKNARTAILKAFTDQTGGAADLDLGDGVPPAAAKPKTESSWDKAQAGAENFLRKQNRAAAQG